MHNNSTKGFSLVELAVTLVIAGVVLTGVSARETMYDEAKLSSVIEDLTQYKTAFDAFKLKYGQVPGDFSNASAFFGRCSMGEVEQTFCNGDGNGFISHGILNEVNKAWVHLTAAKMLGVAPNLNDSNTTTKIGENAPASKINGAGYIIISSDTNGAAMFGAQGIGITIAKEGAANETLNKGALTPLQAFSLDKKMDDSKEIAGTFTGATTGMVRGYNETNDGLCSDLAANTYNTSETTTSCIMGQSVNNNLGTMILASSGGGGGGGPDYNPSGSANFSTSYNEIADLASINLDSAEYSGCDPTWPGYYAAIYCGRLKINDPGFRRDNITIRADESGNYLTSTPGTLKAYTPFYINSHTADVYIYTINQATSEVTNVKKFSGATLTPDTETTININGVPTAAYESHYIGSDGKVIEGTYNYYGF